MAVLPKGANAPLVGSKVFAALAWTEAGTSHDIDLCGLLIGADGKVRDDADFVFYNHPRHASGAVVHDGRSGTLERITVDVEKLPAGIEQVVLVGSISGGSFGDVSGLVLSIVNPADGAESIRFEDMGATSETALVVGELYRRNGQWKFRAVGQGWDTGLAGLATDYGVSIAGDTEPTPAAAAAPVPEPSVVASQPAAEVALVPAPGTPTDVVAATASAPAPVVAPTPGRDSGAVVRPLLPVAKTDPGTPGLGAESLALPIGRSLLLLQGGQTPDSLWLRVTHTGGDGAPGADASVLAYNEYGDPQEVVYFGGPVGASSAIRSVSKPINADAYDTAAIELRLGMLDDSVVGLVVAATSYEGQSLSGNGAFVTEVVAADGTVHARSETPAPNTTGTLLLALRRDGAGAWLLSPLATSAPARTAKGLVGAGRWALSA